MNLVGTLGKLLLSGAMSKGGGAGGLGSLLGGSSQGGAGGLADLLGGLTGGNAGGGGLGGLLGQLQGQQGAAAAGEAGGLLGTLLGGGGTSGSAAGGNDMGALLGNALGQQAPGAQATTSSEQSDQAAVLIRAMVNAAKADGAVDTEEQEKIVGQLGDIGPEEANFIRAEMQAPLDIDGFVRSVPSGLRQQVYVLSLMSINLDSKAEADYLDAIAKGFGISEQASNQIHAQLGVPQLYS